MKEYDTVSNRWKFKHDISSTFLSNDFFLKSSKITRNVRLGGKRCHSVIYYFYKF